MKNIILMLLLVVATSTQAQNIFHNKSEVKVNDITFSVHKIDNDRVVLHDKNPPKISPTVFGKPSQKYNSTALKLESYKRLVEVFKSVFSESRVKELIRLSQEKPHDVTIDNLLFLINIIYIVNDKGDVKTISIGLNENLLLTKEEVATLYKKLLKIKVLFKDDFTGTNTLIASSYLDLDKLYK